LQGRAPYKHFVYIRSPLESGLKPRDVKVNSNRGERWKNSVEKITRCFNQGSHLGGGRSGRQGERRGGGRGGWGGRKNVLKMGFF